MKQIARGLGISLLWLLSQAATALDEASIPPVLKPWVPWVLEREPEHNCPFLFSENLRQCSWASELSLDLNAAKGRFEQRWSLYREGWIRLPGGNGHWPSVVKLNDEAVAVTSLDGAPSLRLPAGDYRISGEFQWDKLPESLPIPDETGLIHLSINGKAVDFPYLDKDQHRLWIQGQQQDPQRKPDEDRLDIQVFRKLQDDLPMLVESRLRLQVSGSQREVLLDHPMLARAIPLRIDSPLPARLEGDGRLRVQVQPGTWEIRFDSRFAAEVLTLQAPAENASWPAEEIWVFDARPSHRLVETSGGVAVDPRQTNSPSAWHNLPAYRMQQGERLAFQVQRRGDPVPEPNQLQIQREFWLDFDGQGYTVKDRFSGKLTSGWRLQASPRLQLGRVLLDGEPQYITQMQDTQGVEARRGAINMVAESRLEGDIGTLGAAGWLQDFSKVSMTLNLPSGWQTFSIHGSDNIPRTWLQRWTLLDLFIVLMTAITVARLWGWHWGGLALVALALLWHEPGAPQFVWLNIVAAAALLRVVPEAGRLRRITLAYRALGLLALLLITIPFVIQEVRVGIYPQLERPWQSAMQSVGQSRGYGGEVGIAYAPEAPMPEPMTAAKEEMPEDKALPMPAPLASIATMSVNQRAKSIKRQANASVVQAPMIKVDPNAVIQTGPGLPQWQWNRVQLSWNGPVEQTQQVRIIYLSPTQNLFLNGLRILLLLWLAYRLVEPARWREWLPNGRTAATALLLIVCAPLLGLLPGGNLVAGEIPPPEMLDELRSRLLEPPRCLPACADIPQARMTASTDRLQLRLQVDVLATAAVSLPGIQAHWLPDRVNLDGQAVRLRRDEKGALWVLLEAGRHQLTLDGPLPDKDRVQIPFSLSPRQLQADLDGWTLEGLDKQGVPAGQVQLQRVRNATTQDKPGAAWLSPELPPFVQLERELKLGLDWHVVTRIKRLSPLGTAAVLRIPLLEGESVTSPDIEVKNGHARVTLGANVNHLAWDSILTQSAVIRLQAAKVDQWVEKWVVDVSPIWHMKSEGIPVVHHTNPANQWLPTWQPWPGEAVSLHISRPEGSQGNSLTIQQAQLQVTPGQRATDAILKLQLQSSQGGRHSIRLPEEATLQTASINGKTQPIRQQGSEVSLPINPGLQRIELQWRKDTTASSLFRTPSLDLNAPAVNLSITASLPQDRWLLFVGGPSMGPAVLFWGVFITLALGAVVLSRIPGSPLKHYQWFLLGLGLTQADLFAALVVVAWLLGLSYRGKMEPPRQAWRFDSLQIGLALLSLFALVSLFASVQQGLLGQPDMMVAGNNSTAYQLQWYQDRVASDYPQAWVLSLPILAYRLVMLLWAMWLAFSLVNWLRWGWKCYSHQELWLKLNWKRNPQPPRGKATTPPQNPAPPASGD